MTGVAERRVMDLGSTNIRSIAARCVRSGQVRAGVLIMTGRTARILGDTGAMVNRCMQGLPCIRMTLVTLGRIGCANACCNHSGDRSACRMTGQTSRRCLRMSLQTLLYCTDCMTTVTG